MSAAMTAKMTKEFRSPPLDQVSLLLRSLLLANFECTGYVFNYFSLVSELASGMKILRVTAHFQMKLSQCNGTFTWTC